MLPKNGKLIRFFFSSVLHSLLLVAVVGCGSDSDNEFRDPSPVVGGGADNPDSPLDTDWRKKKQSQKDLENDLKDEAKKEGSEADKFQRVMKHILHWEGGCSDHPADSGGRTFMGITTGRARENGWSGDVCQMPRKRVLSIYREDYWNVRARKHPWPLDLAVMNTEVNSGGGKAKEFLERMQRMKLEGSARSKAGWYVDQQTEFYRAIVARNPSQNVFLQGWLNRSRYMKDVISGRRATAEYVFTGFALSSATGGGAKAMMELPSESSVP
ncbi:MAG: hypothetical protein IOD12_16980 [Silvanigrellales bacterium]|nr:hypothetical protein [Silvanigrellales bacterium]